MIVRPTDAELMALYRGRGDRPVQYRSDYRKAYPHRPQRSYPNGGGGAGGGPPETLPGFDGGSTIYNPTLATHWRALNLPIPGHDWLTQDDGVTNSGGLVDVVRGAILVKQGTGQTYQIATTDPAAYATKSIAGTDGTASQGFNMAAGELWDILHGKIKIYGTIEPVAPAATRTIIAMTGAASAAFQVLNSSGIKFRVTIASGSTVNGTVAHTAGHRYPYIATMFSNTLGTAGIVRFLTPIEFFTATWAGQADNTKGIGPAGSASLTACASPMSRFTVFQGAAAEFIENMGGGGAQGDKAFLQALGWTGFTF